MRADILIPLTIVLAFYGFCIWFVVRPYRVAEMIAQAHYRVLADQEDSIPKKLSTQVKALHAMGFQYLAAYIMSPPAGFRQKLPIHYVFDSKDSSIKATLMQIGQIKATAFETIYPDGMLLVTVHGMPAWPYENIGKDELYQAIVSKGTLEKAWDDHGPQAAALRAFHGAPVQTQSPEAFLQLMNEHIMPRDQKQTVYVIAKRLRRIAFSLVGMVGVFVVPILVSAEFNNPLWYVLVPLAGLLLLSPIWLTALVLAGRIKRKYLPTSEPPE
jgi:hypothetical protein